MLALEYLSDNQWPKRTNGDDKKSVKVCKRPLVLVDHLQLAGGLAQAEA
jgi:hypothetical protein